MKSRNILFIGTIMSNYGILRNNGVSAASTQWSNGLLDSLMKNGCNIHNLSHIWNRTFPFGKIIPGTKLDLATEYSTTLVRFINIKGVRIYSLYKGLLKGFLKLNSKKGLPDIILFYNAYYFNILLAKKVKSMFPNLKLILIVLDLQDPDIDNWSKFKKDFEIFDGCIFLSWWAYINAPIDNKIHIDAGWDGIIKKSKKNKDTSEIIFLYAGKMHKFGGVQILIEAIKKIPAKIKNIRFEFFGKEVSSELIDLSKIDNRVVVKGFVSEYELEEAFDRSHVFLSPLDLTYSDNKMVFPSKILNYLRYKKPILASKSKGISRDYDDVLFYPESNDAQGWLSLILRLYSFTVSEYSLVESKSEKLLNQKRWDNHVEKLIGFTENI